MFCLGISAHVFLHSLPFAFIALHFFITDDGKHKLDSTVKICFVKMSVDHGSKYWSYVRTCSVVKRTVDI